MAVGLSDGTGYKDTGEWLSSAVVDKRSDKQIADAQEMARNSQSGDFQSRFDATYEPTMVPQASTELSGALKDKVGSMVGYNTGNTTVDNFLNNFTGSGGKERIQSWPESTARGIGTALTHVGEGMEGKIPVDVMNQETGEFEPNPQTIKDADVLAGLAVMGPMPLAKKAVDGTLGSFMGVKSRLSDKNALAEAQIMNMNGVHPDEIWEKTGWARAPDGRWKTELNDEPAKINTMAFDVKSNQTPKTTPVTSDAAAGPKGWTTIEGGPPVDMYTLPQPKTNFFGEKDMKKLPEILDHPDLYKAYPELKTYKVAPIPAMFSKDALAWHSPGDRTIYMGPLNQEALKPILMHEVQHAIQTIEGFAGGSNAAYLQQKFGLTEEQALERYRRTMGEVEARNVQARINYGDKARNYTPPDMTQDVPSWAQIHPEGK